MQLSTLLVSAVLALGVAADTHPYGNCFDRFYTGINEGNRENNKATQAACDAYRRRNTGNKWWDTCPDCSTSYRGDVLVCNSPAKHIGGDELEYYCRQAGADGSHGD